MQPGRRSWQPRRCGPIRFGIVWRVLLLLQRGEKSAQKSRKEAKRNEGQWKMTRESSVTEPFRIPQVGSIPRLPPDENVLSAPHLASLPISTMKNYYFNGQVIWNGTTKGDLFLVFIYSLVVTHFTIHSLCSLGNLNKPSYNQKSLFQLAF